MRAMSNDVQPCDYYTNDSLYVYEFLKWNRDNKNNAWP